jgi:hypothetical protein
VVIEGVWGEVINTSHSRLPGLEEAEEQEKIFREDTETEAQTRRFLQGQGSSRTLAEEDEAVRRDLTTWRKWCGAAAVMDRVTQEEDTVGAEGDVAEGAANHRVDGVVGQTARKWRHQGEVIGLERQQTRNLERDSRSTTRRTRALKC